MYIIQQIISGKNVEIDFSGGKPPGKIQLKAKNQETLITLMRTISEGNPNSIMISIINKERNNKPWLVMSRKVLDCLFKNNNLVQWRVQFDIDNKTVQTETHNDKLPLGLVIATDEGTMAGKNEARNIIFQICKNEQWESIFQFHPRAQTWMQIDN